MVMRNDITAEYVRQLLTYDTEKGMLVWKRRTPSMFFKTEKQSAEWICAKWNSRHAGKVAGCIRDDGYCRVRIDDVLYYGHRIAWLVTKGKWPPKELDHRFGVKSGNDVENLRPATRAQNSQNMARSSRNTSGHTGVSWSKIMKKWHAYINVDGHRINIGHFDNLEKAASAYLAAKKKHHVFQPDLRAAR